jgi:hypothetical protein
VGIGHLDGLIVGLRLGYNNEMGLNMNTGGMAWTSFPGPRMGTTGGLYFGE